MTDFQKGHLLKSYRSIIFPREEDQITLLIIIQHCAGFLEKEESIETETEKDKDTQLKTLQIEQTEIEQIKTVNSENPVVEDQNKTGLKNLSENDLKLDLNLTCKHSNKNKGRLLYERNKITNFIITDWEKKSLLIENKDFLCSSAKRAPKKYMLNSLFKEDQRGQSYSPNQPTLEQQTTKFESRGLKYLSQSKSPKSTIQSSSQVQKQIKEEEQDREFRRRTHGTFNQKNLIDFHTKVQIIKNLKNSPFCNENQKQQSKLEVNKQLSTDRSIREEAQLSEYSSSTQKTQQQRQENNLDNSSKINSKIIHRGSLSLPPEQNGDNKQQVKRNDLNNPCYFLRQKYPEALRPRRKEEINSSFSSFSQSHRSISSSISADKCIENTSLGSKQEKNQQNRSDHNSSKAIENKDSSEANIFSIQNVDNLSSQKRSSNQKQRNQETATILKLSPDLNEKQASTYQQLNGFMLDMIYLKKDVHRLHKERINMRKQILKVSAGSQIPSDNYSVKDFISFVQSYKQYV